MTDLVHFLLDELVLLAARELLATVRVRHFELVALLLGDAELRFRLSGLGLISLVGLHRRVEFVQHAEYLLVRLVADLATLGQCRMPLITITLAGDLLASSLDFRKIVKLTRWA